MGNYDLQRVKDIVVHMTPQEQAELVDWVEDSLKPTLANAEHIDDPLLDERLMTMPATGAEIAALLNQIGPIELVDPHITDPVEWVEAQRQKRRIKLEAD